MKRLLSVEQYILIGFILALFFATLLPFLQALLLGFFMSLLLYPWYVRFLKKTGMPRPLAALIFTLGFLVVVQLPLILVSFSLVNDVVFLAEKIRTEAPTWFDQITHNTWILDLRERLNSVTGSNPINLHEKAIAGITLLGTKTLDFLGVFASRIPGFFLDVGIFLMALFFGLLDGPRLVRLLKEALPFDQNTVEKLIRTTEGICRGVMLGTLIVSLLQGFIVGAGYALCGIPNPLLFGFITAVLSVVPLVGSAPVGFGGALFLAANHQYGAAIAMVCFAVFATLADNIVKPWALKGYSSIHPLLAILSLIGGLALFGISGVFMGPLISALALVVIKVMIEAPKTETRDECAQVVS